jgi:succinyl-CoA synthetase alpha subunit
MAIFLTEHTRVIVQGIAGAEGGRHTRRMLAAGTAVVGGVNPRKAGSTVDVDGNRLPVFASVAAAMDATGADATVAFVPPAHTLDAGLEAIGAGIGLAVVITEGVPAHDTAALWAHALGNGNKTRIIGPNCPGVISPGRASLGIIPADITGPGRIGLVSKSGTLTYQMMHELRDLGFSTCVGIGGDPITGTTHIDCLRAFEDDPGTDAIVLIGEIGGDTEGRAAGVHRGESQQAGVGRGLRPAGRAGSCGGVVPGPLDFRHFGGSPGSVRSGRTGCPRAW